MVGAFIPSIAGRPPARRPAGRPRPRAAARHAVLPRPRQPRLRQERERRHAVRRLRAEPGRRAGRTACRGSTARASRAGRHRALRAADGRRDPALPVPRRCRGDPARLPSGRDDPGRRTRCSARCRACGGFWVAAGLSLNGFGGAGGIGRALAELDDRAATPRSTSARTGPWRFGRHVPRPGRSRPAWPARTYRYYYRLRYPLRLRPGRPAAAAVARCTDGSRSSARCSARRTAGSGPTTSRPGGRGGAPARTSARFGWTRPPWFERVAAEHRGVPRAGRDHRPQLVRQDRGRGTGRAGAARARLRQPDRPAGRQPWSTRQFLDERGGIVADVTVTPPGR